MKLPLRETEGSAAEHLAPERLSGSKVTVWEAGNGGGAGVQRGDSDVSRQLQDVSVKSREAAPKIALQSKQKKRTKKIASALLTWPCDCFPYAPVTLACMWTIFDKSLWAMAFKICIYIMKCFKTFNIFSDSEKTGYHYRGDLMNW